VEEKGREARMNRGMNRESEGNEEERENINNPYNNLRIGGCF
jgi:hypothetical protein